MVLTTDQNQKPTVWVRGAVTEAHLLCLNEGRSFGTIGRRESIYLLSLAGKPMLDRMLGRLADLEIDRVYLYVARHADAIDRYVAEGRRWGMHVTTVDLSSHVDAFRRILTPQRRYPILVADATVFPTIHSEHITDNGMFGHLVFRGHGGFLPWVVLRAPVSSPEDHPIGSAQELAEAVEKIEEVEEASSDPVLSIAHPADFLRAQEFLLKGQVVGQPIPGNQCDPGIWIGGNVSLHPTATLIPPVFIAPDCRIGRGVRLGPNTVVGNHSIVSEKTKIENACILPETYLGRDLDVEWAMVDRNCLLSGATGVSTAVPDSFLIGPANAWSAAKFFRKLPGVVAGWIALLPASILVGLLYLMAKMMGVRRPIKRYRAVRLPAAESPPMWRTFDYLEFARGRNRFWNGLLDRLRLRRLPTVWNLVRGQVAWVGLRPRRPEQILALSEDWRELYLASKIGIIRLAELDAACTGIVSVDATYSSEAFYTAQSSFKEDLALVWRALRTGIKAKANKN